MWRAILKCARWALTLTHQGLSISFHLQLIDGLPFSLMVIL